MVYVAIGVFVARLLGEEDYPGFAITFWPIIVGLWIAMLFVVMIPCWLADLIRNRKH
jgi:Na+-driven multidrug efflux pump